MTAWTGRVVYACPDCESDLQEDAFALYCTGCEAEVPYSQIVTDPESDPWF